MLLIRILIYCKIFYIDSKPQIVFIKVNETNKLKLNPALVKRSGLVKYFTLHFELKSGYYCNEAKKLT